MKKRLKQLVIQVPLTPDEYYAIKEQSQHSGVPAAAIVRDRAGLIHPEPPGGSKPGAGRPAIEAS